MHSCLDVTNGLLQSNYRAQGAAALNHRRSALHLLLQHRQLPVAGWNRLYIDTLLNELSMMDSNNFIDTVGVGEREGRVYSAIVRERHWQLAHGIGRSGDLTAQQPKAAGSSLLLTLTQQLTLHAIKLAGLEEAKQVLLLPVATGMSIVLALTAIKQQHPKVLQQQKDAVRYAQACMASINSPATLTSSSPPTSQSVSVPLSVLPPQPACIPPLYVIWSRIDQKTCLKSIFAAGLIPVVIELIQEGDQLVTDVAGIERAIQRLGAENICALVSTTSCFAPRAPDKVVDMARLAQKYGIPHLVNNAYGLQASLTCKQVTSAQRKGRVDVVVSSMDKNFMVPVGGAVLIGFNAKEKKQQPRQTTDTKPTIAAAETNKSRATTSVPQASTTASSKLVSSSSVPLNVLQLVSSLYPGRASSSSILDLFITLLQLGQEGWIGLLRRREELLPRFQARLQILAASTGERLLQVPDNPISFGMTLDHLIGEDVTTGEDMTSAIDAVAHSLDSTGADTTSDASSSVSVSSSSVVRTPAGKDVEAKFVPSYLGSLLFSRNVSGPRVLSAASPTTQMHGLSFHHYGTHSNAYPHSYITAACGIGMEEQEVELFAQRLEKCIREFQKQRAKTTNRSSTPGAATSSSH